MESKYAYLAPKVSYQKGLLLRVEGIRRVLMARSLEDVVSVLRESSAYGPYVQLLKPPFTSIALERVLRRALIDTLVKVREAAPSGPPKELLTTLLERQAIDVLKVVLRALAGGVVESLRELVDLEALRPTNLAPVIEEVLKCENLEEAVRVLARRPKLGPYALKALAAYEEVKDAIVIPMFMDKYVYDRLAELWSALKGADKTIALRILGLLADSYNVMTVLNGIRRGVPEDLITSALTRLHYLVPLDQLQSMSKTRSLWEALTRFSQTMLYSKIQRVLGLTPATIDELSVALKRLVRVEAESILTAPAFNIGAAIAISLVKEYEVEDLTLISTGIEYGISMEHIANMMVFFEAA